MVNISWTIILSNFLTIAPVNTACAFESAAIEVASGALQIASVLAVGYVFSTINRTVKIIKFKNRIARATIFLLAGLLVLIIWYGFGLETCLSG